MSDFTSQTVQNVQLSGTAPAPPKVFHLVDADVDEAVDEELRLVLSESYPGTNGPEDSMYAHKRFDLEMPTHRFIIGSLPDGIQAHLALHDNRRLHVGSPDGEKVIIMGGISEVLVRPQYRGKGYVKLLMNAVHEYLRSLGFEYSILQGELAIYKSSGYHEVDVKWQKDSTPVVPIAGAPMGEKPWPEGTLYLEGLPF